MVAEFRHESSVQFRIVMANRNRGLSFTEMSHNNRIDTSLTAAEIFVFSTGKSKGSEPVLPFDESKVSRPAE